MAVKEVTLEEREFDYARAEKHCMDVAELYVEARAKHHHIPPKLIKLMDEAMEELKRAKRRLERTQRRLEKRRTTV